MSESSDNIRPTTELAVAILEKLQHSGYLTRDAHKIALTVLKDTELVISTHTAERRKALAGYFTWWGRIAHEDHKESNVADFWLCQHPMCESLVRSIHDFSRETQPAATPAAGEITPLS